MHELFHDFDFLEGLVALEGVDMDTFQCEGPVLAVLGEVDTAEAALADCLDDLVVLHDRI